MLPSSLCLLQDRPMNLRHEVLRQGMWLFAKLADWKDGRLMPLNNHRSRVWMPGSYIDQRWGWGWGNKVKRPSILQISPRMTSFKQRMCSFLPSCHLQVDRVLKKDTFSLTVRKRGRVIWGSSLCMIIITKTTKKQVKETAPPWSQNWLSPATIPHCPSPFHNLVERKAMIPLLHKVDLSESVWHWC